MRARPLSLAFQFPPQHSVVDRFETDDELDQERERLPGLLIESRRQGIDKMVEGMNEDGHPPHKPIADVLKDLEPLRDLAKNWDIDIASW